jgi:hypothetical protein
MRELALKRYANPAEFIAGRRCLLARERGSEWNLETQSAGREFTDSARFFALSNAGSDLAEGLR